jgi:hypothetical protein
MKAAAAVALRRVGGRVRRLGAVATALFAAAMVLVIVNGVLRVGGATGSLPRRYMTGMQV